MDLRVGRMRCLERLVITRCLIVEDPWASFLVLLGKLAKGLRLERLLAVGVAHLVLFGTWVGTEVELFVLDDGLW